LNRVQGDDEMYRVASRSLLTPRRAEPECNFKEKAFFEYHLYTMQRPASIANRNQAGIAT